MVTAEQVQRTQQPPARRPDQPEPRPFSVNVTDIPSSAIGVLATGVLDDLDRLAKRARRDGYTATVTAAKAVLEQIAADLEHEAAGRDRARWLEARR